MGNPIVEALLEDEDFQNGVDRLVDLANTTDELPISEQIDEALAEHGTIRNLIERVEELEARLKLTDLQLKAQADVLKKEAPEVKEGQPVGELKPIEVSCSEYSVVEDENYNQGFARKNKGKWELMHLYKVMFDQSSGTGLVTKYVLAESAKGAADQAECGSCLDDETIASVRVTQLPFMLCGWSANQF